VSIQETLVFSIQVVVDVFVVAVGVAFLSTATDAYHFLAWHLLMQKVSTVFCHVDI
jgi:hypothetical protein